jgi:hypothetical protein
MAKEAAGGELGRVGDAKPVLQASATPVEVVYEKTTLRSISI